MTTDQLNTLKELFNKLLDCHQKDPHNIDTYYINQLQGVEESLGLLKDVIDELRMIDPQSVNNLKSLTLQIFDEDDETF